MSATDTLSALALAGVCFDTFQAAQPSMVLVMLRSAIQRAEAAFGLFKGSLQPFLAAYLCVLLGCR